MSNTSACPAGFDECLKLGEEIFAKAANEKGGSLLTDQRVSFNEEASSLRWFMLPSEAQSLLRGEQAQKAQVPFTPRKYTTESTDYGYQHFSTIPTKPTAFNAAPEERVTVDCPVENGCEDADVDQSDDDGNETDSESENFNLTMAPYDDEDSSEGSSSLAASGPSASTLWKTPGKNIMKPTLEAVTRYKMIGHGDRVLVCVSGGKDSLTLLHTLRRHQERSKRFGVEFDLGVVTVDPGSSAYDPSVLIPYMAQLSIPYYYERQCKL